MAGHVNSDAELLRGSYSQVSRSSGNSVRAAWRFGQMLDSMSDAYTRADMAIMVGVSVATISKYMKFYASFQRAELALDLAERIESWDVQVLILATETGDIPVRRPLAGRHYRYRCNHCHSDDIAREEYDPDSLVTA